MKCATLISVVLLAASLASTRVDADQTPKPDLTLVWSSGEMSRDMSLFRATFTVFGTKVHYATYSVGRYPQENPPDVDGVVKDPSKLAALLAAFDKVPVPKKQEEIFETRYEKGCLKRGTKERCAQTLGNAPEGPDLKALRAVYQTLLEGVAVSPL